MKILHSVSMDELVGRFEFTSASPVPACSSGGPRVRGRSGTRKGSEKWNGASLADQYNAPGYLKCCLGSRKYDRESSKKDWGATIKIL